MTIPSATEDVRDFGLGLTSPAVMTPVVLGATGGTTKNVLTFYSSLQQLRDDQVEGPAVGTVANILAKGGGPVGLVPLTTSVAGSNGTVTASGGGAASDITLSGTSALDAHVRVEILKAGTRGTATFRYVCDGYTGDTASERTYSETLTTPTGGAFAVPGLGITITFANAINFQVGWAYEFDVQCAAPNATDLATGFAALAASSTAWRFVTFVTSKANGDATAHAVLVAALQSQLAALAAGSRYRRGMMPADQADSSSAVLTAYASTTANRCLIAFGRVRRTTTKPFPGFAFPVTHGVDVFAARAASSLPSTDLKRVKSGALDEVIKLFADENATPTGLDDLKISTLRTYPNNDPEGFFMTQARLKSASGSDFKLWPHGIVMDIACETVHSEMILVIGRGLRYNSDGTIDNLDAVDIEEDVAAKLVTKLMSPQNAEGFAGYVQKVQYKIDRTWNVGNSGVLIGTVGVKPFSYIDFARTSLGFVTDIPAPVAA